MKKVAVIGAGTIGSSWALLFTLKGLIVSIYDLDEDNLLHAMTKIKDNMYFLYKKNMLTESKKTEALSNIKLMQDIDSAVAGAFMIQESVSENYTVKNDVFKKVENFADSSAIIASSTSTLSVNRMQNTFSFPERFLVAHPFNPPHLIPLIEIVPGVKTSEKTTETVKTFYQEIGKEPIVVKKEVHGHIANRLAAALWREAIDLVEQEVCSVKEIDRAISSGPGLRWALMGPHLTYHLGGGRGGIEHFLKHLGPAFEAMMKDLANWDNISEKAKQKLIKELNEECGKENMERLAIWRDEKLIALLKLKDVEI